MLTKIRLLVLLALVTFMANAQPLAVNIDASKTGAPITKLMFGGFMEPATTALWAELLYDRKFAYDINAKPDAATPAAVTPGTRPQVRWRPVGPAESVVMDTKNPYAGEQTPRITLDGSTPRGISQSALGLRTGKAYTGRVVLAGDATAKVEVSLIWGPGPSDRQTIAVGPLSVQYVKFPLKFTARGNTDDGRLEIAATGKGAFHIGAVSLMPADNVQGYHASWIRYLKDQGVTIARWPGGNFVSGYNWRDGLGDPDKRPSRIGPVRPTLETNDVGIDEFMTMCRLLGAEPYVAVNSGFGDDHSAAEEVEYCNGPAATPMGKLRAANGHPEPYKVRIWGVGNEMYGPWQYGYMALNQYWVKHIMLTKAMRAVDPSIEVVASAATIEEMGWCAIDQEQFFTSPLRGRLTKKLPFEYGSREDWTGGLLTNAADYIDHLGEHFYAYPDLMFDAEKQRFVDANDPLELTVRRLANRVTYKFEAWEEYLKRMPSLKGKNVKFALDEWSTRNQTVQAVNRGQRGDMQSALSVALSFQEMFRHTDLISLVTYSGGIRRTILSDATGEAVGFNADGAVFKLLARHFPEKLPVSVGGNSPQRPIRGTVGVDTSRVPSGSPTYPLDVVAALSADRKVLTVSVVNPTESAQECDLKIAGIQLGGAGKLWRIVAPGPHATNVAGKPPAVAIIELPVGEVPARLTVPPISVNVYEFAAR